MSLREFEIQQSIVEWLSHALPVGSLVHPSPNEGRHNVQFRVKQKRMGMQPGWPDLEILVASIYFKQGIKPAPIFLEVKTDKGRLSKNQTLCLDKLRAISCHVCLVRSIDDAQKFLSELMSLQI